MLLDAQLQLSAAQALTATAVSTNSIDLGSARQIAVGSQVSVLLCSIVGADFTSANETYQVDIQTDDNSSFSSPTVIASTVIPAAQLPTGGIFALSIPRTRMERYMRLNYTLGGTTPSWTVSAFVQPTDMIQSTQNYPLNYVVTG